MFLELSSKSLYLTSEKKKKILSSVHVLLKRDIKKFHFVVVQRWQRNVQKSVMHVQSCCFAVLFFCRSPCRRRYLSSQMTPTVTPVLTSHANVLRYSFLMGGYTNFSCETLRTFFINTLFKRLVNKLHIGNKLREGLKHFAAYALSRRICPMDFFLILKLKKHSEKNSHHLRVQPLSQGSPLLVLRRERTRTRTLMGTSWREPWEWVSVS